MTLSELRDHLASLTGHVTFEYKGLPCGVDPLSLHIFDMWYGNAEVTVDSVEKVIDEKLFDGKALTDIWDDVTDLAY